MTPILQWRSSTLIANVLRGYVKSFRSVVSSACPRCGLTIVARIEDGTSYSLFRIDCAPPNASPFNVVLEVTDDGRHSISCGCSRSAGRR